MSKYLYNFYWLFSEKILRIFGGLFVTIWVARYLGPHDFGMISYGLAFVAFFSWASQLGLDQIVVRELAKNPENTSSILGATFVLKLIGSIFAVFLVTLATYFLDVKDDLLKWIILLNSAIFIFQTFNVFDLYFQANVLSKKTSIARNAGLLLSSLLKIYFILNEYSVIYFVMANVIDFVVAGFILALLYRKMGNHYSTWRFDWCVSKQLLVYSWPLMISSFLITIHMKIDQIMIEDMLSLSDVGVYNVAVKLSESWYFIPVIVVSTLMPYFVKLREANFDLYIVRLQQLLSFMFWLGVIVGLGAIFYGHFVIVTMFGEVYEASYYALVYNIWAGLFIAQGLTAGIWQISENLQIYRVVTQLAAVVVNVSANIYLIPKYGITGAAFATLVTQVGANWIFGMAFREVRPACFMAIKGVSPHYFVKFVFEKYFKSIN